MWLGPTLKFASARIKVEDAAAILIDNWGGDRWGHTVSCSFFDYFKIPRRSHVERYTLCPPMGEMLCALEGIGPNDVEIRYEYFWLRPCYEVPEGEVWLKFPDPRSL